MNYTDKQIEDLSKRIYEGSIDPSTDLPEDLYMAIGKHLEKALYKGYGGAIDDFAFGGTDQVLLDTLRNNIYMFSGAKIYQQCREMADLAAKAKNFKEFRDEARKVYDQYNVNWLKSEYNTAIGQADQAAQWNDIEADKELFPFLRYVAVMDKNTSEICRPLDNVTLPVDHPLWNKYTPLNHFNCRCILEKIDKYEKVKQTTETKLKSITKELDENVDPVFKMNPGKDGYIFSPEHPYFQVAAKDKAFAQRNFDLPIPPAPVKGIEIKSIGDAGPIVKKLYDDLQGIKIKDVLIAKTVKPAELGPKLTQLRSLLSDYNIPSHSSYKSFGIEVRFLGSRKYHGAVNTFVGGRINWVDYGKGTDSFLQRDFVKGNTYERFKSRVDKDKNDLSTLTHEFAHTLGIYSQRFVYGTIDKKYISFWNDLHVEYKSYLKELKSLTGTDMYDLSLGMYAKTNTDEFFAEAFTEYKLSSNPSKYAKIVGNLVDKTFKK
jgi:SPP1 gp7 family putative phage head morphogenesis protein